MIKKIMMVMMKIMITTIIIIIMVAVSSIGTCSQYSWRQTGGPFYFLSTVMECSLTFLDDHDENLVMGVSIMMLREV